MAQNQSRPWRNSTGYGSMMDPETPIIPASRLSPMESMPSFTLRKRKRAPHRQAGPLAVLILLLLAFALAGCRSEDEEEGSIFKSEGFAGAPLDLGVLIPQTTSRTVGTNGSYYKIAVTITTAYTVTISQLLDDADLFVFGITDFFVDPPLCISVNNGIVDDSCIVTSDGVTLFIFVKSLSEAGTSFTLTINP